MAAIARPQGGGGSIKVALIVFVVLTVLSLAGTIIILTQYSDMQAQETDARNQAAQASKNLQTTQRQLESFAQIATGKAVTDPVEIQKAINDERNRIAADPVLKLPADTALLTMLRTLHEQFVTQGEALKKTSDEAARLDAELKKLTEETAAERKSYADKAADLEKRFQDLEQQSNKDRESWQQQVASLTQQLEKASEAAGAQLTAERQQLQSRTKERDEAQARVKELVATLASFRPQPDLTSAMQIADGEVVRAVAGEDIVYITLGQRDGLKRGMTFAVYSRIGGIPEDGQGKATIRVDEIFETTSECKVTSSAPGQPIIEGDLVANPVYDKTRKLNFVVSGDFDLNFDGQIDDPGGVKVTKLITQAGGNVVQTVDTRTDFVVLGASPPPAFTGNANDSPEAQERAAKREAELKAFDGIVREAKALSIPVLSRTQFLHFIGIKVPRNVPNDKLPS